MRWFLLMLPIAALLMTIAIVAVVEEPYAVTAVVAPRATEARGLELGTLGSLSELAGGGRRPIFEEFVFLLSSEASYRELLAEDNPEIQSWMAALNEPGALQRVYYGVLNGLRALSARDPRKPSSMERAVKLARKSAKTRKTPEGYMTLTVTARDSKTALSLLNGVVRVSDEAIRRREQDTYRQRVELLLDMANKSQRPNEQAAISSAIERDFARYVSSLSSTHYSFQYVVAPRPEPSPRYVNSIKVFALCMVLGGLLLLGAVAIRARLRQ